MPGERVSPEGVTLVASSSALPESVHQAVDRRRRAQPPSQNIRRRILQRNLLLFLMFLPAVLYFVIFHYAPMFGIVMAFQDFDPDAGFFGSTWVGLKHFESIFRSPVTVRVIYNTVFISVLQILVGFPIPIILALLLNEVRLMWFKRTVQTLVYLPHFFSWVIMGGIVFTLFAQETGTINNLLQNAGQESVPFLYNPGSWLTILIGSGIWKEAGFGAIVYLAALATIDPTLYEAAAIDGANRIQRIWHVSLPGIVSIIIMYAILSMGSIFSVGFDPVYILQNPTVYSISQVSSVWSFQMGVQNGLYALAAAMGLFQGIIQFILLVIANSIARRFGRSLW